MKTDKKYYVYHLIDPRTDCVFYVGKGTGDRINHHERDARNLRFANSEKEQAILDIWESGNVVKKKIVMTFDSERDAYSFEKKEMFRIGFENLTNIVGSGEPEALKAMRRGEAFIKMIKKNIPHMSNSRAEIARELINEMLENISHCKRIIGA